MIHPTYTHPGVNAALLNLSRSRSRAIKWKRVEQQSELNDLAHTKKYARRAVAAELMRQHHLLTILLRLAA